MSEEWPPDSDAARKEALRQARRAARRALGIRLPPSSPATRPMPHHDDERRSRRKRRWLYGLLVPFVVGALGYVWRSRGEAEEPAGIVAELCAAVRCGDGQCSPAEHSPWGSVCPEDCATRFTGTLSAELPPLNDYCDDAAEYRAVNGTVPEGLRVNPASTPVVDRLTVEKSVLVAPQEYCRETPATRRYVYLNGEGGEPACRGIASEHPTFVFEVGSDVPHLHVDVKMNFPVAMILRAPNGTQSCVDSEYRERSACEAGHAEQYAARGRPVELALDLDAPPPGNYAVWVTRLSWWDGMGRGTVTLRTSTPPTEAAPTVAAASADWLPGAPGAPPDTLPPAAVGVAAAAAQAPAPTQGNLPPGEHLAVPTGPDTRTVTIEPASSPELERAEQLYDRCSITEDASERRRIGQEGLEALRGVGGANRVSADVLRGRLQRCVESLDGN